MNQNQVVQCTNCTQTFPITLTEIVDAQADPESKARLLSGRINAFQCPHCGVVNFVHTALLYHDAEKELLIAYVPIELGLADRNAEEKVIGDLMNQLTRNIDQSEFRAYMFNPTRAITMEGLIEQVLEADGISREDIQAQNQRVGLIQDMAVETDENLLDLIRQHDDEIDEDFVQLVVMMANQVLQDGRQDISERLVRVYQTILEQSSYGKEVLKQREQQVIIQKEVADELVKLGDQPQRSDVLELVVKHHESPQHLQAMVELARPVFDYQFFQDFTAYIQREPDSQKRALETARNQLSELTVLADRQMQVAVEQSRALLQQLVESDDLDSDIRENLPMIDDNFMMVLATNIQEAEEHHNHDMADHLQHIQNAILDVMQSFMDPELLFLNKLLSAESDDALRAMIRSEGGEFGDNLLTTIDQVDEIMKSRSEQKIRSRLQFIRNEVEDLLIH